MLKLLFLLPFLILSTALNAQENQFQKDFIINDSLVIVKYIEQIFIPEQLACPPARAEKSEMFREYLAQHYSKFILSKTLTQDSILYFNGKLCSGHSIGTVVVYRIHNGTVKKLFSKFGEIVDLDEENLVIYTYPCCGTRSNVITNYNISGKPKRDTSHVFFSTEDFQEVEYARKNKADQHKITLIKNSGIRSAAKDEVSQFYDPCEKPNTNITNTFNKGVNGYLITINQEKDWALVRFFIKDAFENYCPITYEKEIIDTDDYFVYGWIKVQDFIVN